MLNRFEKQNDAAFLVYEFSNLVVPSEENDDIQFLLSKIDLKSFFKKLASTIRVIEQALSQNNPETICVSFNGGKDCCIVLYLYYAVAKRLNIKLPLKVVLIQIENEFNQMKTFQQELITSFYKSSLKCISFEDTSKSIKECLTELKKIDPLIKNILLGTRRTDSSYFEKMPYFSPTDCDWPEFMRVSPILDWTYHEVWFFIKKLEIPYCILYEQGYTSIDNTQNTVKNECLLSDDLISYLPAFKLDNPKTERCYRKK